MNPEKGLHYFGNHYRPVPLEQTYIGASARGGSLFEAQKSKREGGSLSLFFSLSLSLSRCFGLLALLVS